MGKPTRSPSAGGWKMCSACGLPHPIADFSPDNRVFDGLQASCRASRKKYYADTRMISRQRAKQNYRTRRPTINGRAAQLHAAAKSRANKNDLTFTIEVAHVEGFLAVGRCAVSGIPFDMRARALGEYRRGFAPSIDRIDNSRGYEPDNIQVVCNMFNAGKSEHAQLDFIAMCVAVAERNANDPQVIARLVELRNHAG